MTVSPSLTEWGEVSNGKGMLYPYPWYKLTISGLSCRARPPLLTRGRWRPGAARGPLAQRLDEPVPLIRIHRSRLVCFLGVSVRKVIV